MFYYIMSSGKIRLISFGNNYLLSCRQFSDGINLTLSVRGPPLDVRIYVCWSEIFKKSKKENKGKIFVMIVEP